MTRKLFARFAVAAALAAPGGVALAETPATTGAPLSVTAPTSDGLTLDGGTAAAAATPKYIADATAPKRISFDAGVTFASDYISRGIQLENQGVIVQPYANLYFTAYEGTSAVNKVTLFGGIWSSLHSEDTGASPNTFVESWFEFDWDVGFAVDIGKFNLNVMYIEFLSPNDAFGTARNLQFKLSYNDSDSSFPLSPYAIVFVELDGKAGTGSDEGIYVELGVSPSLPLGGKESGMKLTFPVYVGLGFSDFYGDENGDNETFGYAAAGVVFSTPIGFMSDAGYGAWTFSVGGYFYYFGEGVETANEGAGTDSNWDVVGSMSIGVAF